jgi:hypothetical protein
MTLQGNEDVLGLLAMWLLVVLACAPMSPPEFVKWCAEQWRLFKLDTWADGRYDAPRVPTPGTLADPRVASMDKRQREHGEVLRLQGRSLLAGKRYIPAGTKPLDAPPPKAGRVVPILAARGGKR